MAWLVVKPSSAAIPAGIVLAVIAAALYLSLSASVFARIHR
jgi:hypothetical protein